MTIRNSGGSSPSRRGFLTGAAGLVAASGAAASTPAAAAISAGAANPAIEQNTEPFWGAHQSGIVTPAQGHTYFAAFDLTTEKREDVARVMQAWTAAAARMTAGLPIDPFQEAQDAYVLDDSATTTTTTVSDDDAPPVMVAVGDTGEVHGLHASRLTITFGFGPGLFVKDGKDRYGLAQHRPEAFVDMPTFVGDQLLETRKGGDLSVQACADDPQIAFHAVRQLARIAADQAQIRWTQIGFMPDFGTNRTPRNLMGFKDGTNNPKHADPGLMEKIVWVGNEGPDWMRGGSYLVARRIRIALEHWDRMKVGFQEQTVGRHKDTGAPLGRKNEFDKIDFKTTGKDGNPVLAENSHVRLAAAESNDGARILRRPYSYNDGVNFTAERWPPWRQGMEYDAGLFFISYQRDLRTGFIKIFENMAKLDMMNQFATHVGGAFFACPRGVAKGEFIGQRLFDRA